MAEVYWDLEWTLQQQGFDYTYDKRLYDRLRDRRARPVREHLIAGLEYQDKMARFLENHDEPRASATFSREVHEAAAIITFLSPGLRFFHQGQFEGRTKRISPHLVRAPAEPIDVPLQQFYDRLVEVIRQTGGQVSLGCAARAIEVQADGGVQVSTDSDTRRYDRLVVTLPTRLFLQLAKGLRTALSASASRPATAGRRSPAISCSSTRK